MNYLVGCINNKLGKSNLIKTRFFLVEGDKIEDITESICCAVNVNRISNFNYSKGLAVCQFGCGLQDSNLELLGLKNTKIIMYTLTDIKNVLECKNVFDEGIKERIIESLKSY